MLTTKEAVIKTVRRLPEDASYQDIAEEIAFLAALREAEEAIDAGLVFSNEDVRKKLELWTLN